MSGVLQRGGRRPALAAAAAATLGVASCSLVLDFGGSAAPPDAGIPDASPLAACDTYEPNNTLTAAVAVGTGTHELGLCDGDQADFLAFDLVGGEDVQIDLTFDYAVGTRDLELRLHDRDDGTQVATTTATDGQASIQRNAELGNALPAGGYAVEVVISSTITEPDPAILYELSLSY